MKTQIDRALFIRSAALAALASAILSLAGCGQSSSAPPPVSSAPSLLVGSAYSAACKGDEAAGAKCQAPILSLRPTQFVLGMREVEAKSAEMEPLSPAKLRETLLKKTAPAVIGPGQVLYITDRHHLARALLDIGYGELAIDIAANWSNLDTATFWSQMKANGWCYLNDQNDQPRDPLTLPNDVTQLVDDEYRSLGWAVIDDGSVADTNALFVEFLWGHYFRTQGIVIEPGASDAEFAAAVKLADAASHLDGAKDLPGYIATPAQ